MAEGGVGVGGGAKVRVVRCPKCENLLPELANFTVYKCGGCNTTLQAKKSLPFTEATLENSSDVEELKSNGNCESTLENKEGVSESRLGIIGEVHRAESRVASSDRNASMKTENGEVVREPKVRDTKYQRPSKAPVRDPGMNADVVDADMKMTFETRSRPEHLNGYQPCHKVAPAQAREGREGNVESLYPRNARAPKEGGRLASHLDEGPSNYHHVPSYGYDYGNTAKKKSLNGLDRVEYPGQDQAELLRQLDELRDQLRRSCEVTEKPTVRAPLPRRAVSSTPYGHQGRGPWFPEGLPSLNQTTSRHPRFLSSHSLDIPDHHSLGVYGQNGVSRFVEPFGPQALQGPPYHPPLHHRRRPLDSYAYRRFDLDPVISYPQEDFYHQPACSCLHCYNTHWQPSAHVQPTIIGHRRGPYPANNHGFHPIDGSTMLGPQSYNQVDNVSLHPHEATSRKRTVPVNKNGLPCQPIAGASPFIVCFNCSELLQLPQKLVPLTKNQHKLRCGSCSQVTTFELDGKRLVITTPAPALHVTSEADNGSTDGMRGLHSHEHSNHLPVLSYSGDNDSPCYDIPSSDEKLFLPSSFSHSSHDILEKEPGLNESEAMQGLSSASSTSEEVEIPDNVISKRDVPSSRELPLQAEVSSHVPGVPPGEHFGYPVSNQITDGSEKGSRSKRSDQEKILSIHGTLKQNSIRDVTVATDLSADSYPDHGLSHDSWEAIRDEEHQKSSKGGDSFIAGLIKKSFRDFRLNQSTDNGRSKVSINGHPVSDRLIKKAERQAGTIHPGDYWYDYRAGFWGVMGHPCLGIVPPFIEEFDYPMPRNCSGGNSGVLVNGRELHQKDLDLLVCRGLPAAGERAYIVDISGKVWDEVTGEQLDGLGKLAPTVERVQHGFGMRVPKVVA